MIQVQEKKGGIRGKKKCDGVNGRELLEVAMEKIEGLRRLETEKNSKGQSIKREGGEADGTKELLEEGNRRDRGREGEDKKCTKWKS